MTTERVVRLSSLIICSALTLALSGCGRIGGNVHGTLTSGGEDSQETCLSELDGTLKASINGVATVGDSVRFDLAVTGCSGQYLIQGRKIESFPYQFYRTYSQSGTYNESVLVQDANSPEKYLVVTATPITVIAGTAALTSTPTITGGPNTESVTSTPSTPASKVVSTSAPSDSYEAPRLAHLSEIEPQYRDYEELVDLLKTWESEAEDLVEVGIYGRTTKLKDQYYFRITNEMIPGDKPKCLITGAIHGKELISTWTIMWWISHILQSYGKDSSITELVNSRELYFIPAVSPDSYNVGRYVDGVDPNRDFPADGERESITPIQNLKDFILNRHINAFASGHSYGKVIYYSPNKDSERKAVYSRVISGMDALTSYTAKMGYGTTLDYAWANRQGLFAIVIEFGSNQRAPTVSETRKEFNNTYQAGLYFMLEAPVAFQ